MLFGGIWGECVYALAEYLWRRIKARRAEIVVTVPTDAK